MSFGISSTGFEKMPLTDLIEEIKTDIKGLYPEVTFEPSKAVTQLVVAAAERHYSLWNLFEILFNQYNVYTASGISLDLLVTLNNMKRILAKYSYINNCKIVGLPGTIVPAGFTVISSVDPSIKYEVVNEVVIGPDLGVYAPAAYGDVTITLRSVEKGSFPAAAGTVINIEKGYFGIEEVIQTEDAIPGNSTETDEELLVRREATTSIVKNSTERGILAALSELNYDISKVGLTYIDVISNRSSVVDSRGRSPHSVECIVEQADGGVSRDSEIAQKIFDSVGCGTVIYGEEPLIDVEDIRGRLYKATFTKPVIVPIYCNIELHVTKLLTSEEEAELALNIATYGNKFDVGQNVAVNGPNGLSNSIKNDKILYFNMLIGVTLPCSASFIDISSGFEAIPERASFSTLNIAITQIVEPDI